MVLQWPREEPAVLRGGSRITRRHLRVHKNTCHRKGNETVTTSVSHTAGRGCFPECVLAAGSFGKPGTVSSWRERALGSRPENKHTCASSFCDVPLLPALASSLSG